MNAQATQLPYEITALGLVIYRPLTFDEWRDMAPRFGKAMVSAAFGIGDWLVYGDEHFGQEPLPGMDRDTPLPKVSSEAYDAALAATGLDRSTLLSYAYVSRRVPQNRRVHELSWEHHKAVAPLDDVDQAQWLSVAAVAQPDGRFVSSRRLRKSISAGRLLTKEEVAVQNNDRGQENHIPHVNRLVSWWARMEQSGWLEKSTKEQRDAIRRDLDPVVNIWRKMLL